MGSVNSAGNNDTRLDMEKNDVQVSLRQALKDLQTLLKTKSITAHTMYQKVSLIKYNWKTVGEEDKDGMKQYTTNIDVYVI